MLAGSDGKAHQQAVEVGIKNGADVQVVKGVSAGQNVITSGAYGLPDKTQIKLAQAAPAEEKPGADKGGKSEDKDKD